MRYYVEIVDVFSSINRPENGENQERDNAIAISDGIM